MAVIHISEAEAVGLPTLLARVRGGEELRIDDNGETVAILRAPESRRKTLPEAIRLAKERAIEVRLDGEFESDMEQVIRNHENEGIRNRWQD